MIRLGIIGFGGYGWSLVRTIEKHSARLNCRLVAAADTRMSELPERSVHLLQEAVALSDDALCLFDSMQQQMDAVYIATGIGSHMPLTVAAARRGYHVHLEKPPAGTVQEVDAMRKALADHGRLCLVGFQAVHKADVGELKRRICQGSFGRIRSLSCWAAWPRGAGYYARNDWAGRLQSGRTWVLDGPASNALAHQITNMLLLASDEEGLADPVAVRAELYAAGAVDSHDTAAIEIKTAQGPEIHFLATHRCEGYHNPLITIEAEKARIEWDFNRGATIHHSDGRVETLPGDNANQHGNMVENFIQAVRNEDPAILRCSLDEARKMVLALNGAHESSRRIHRIGPEYLTEEGPDPDFRNIRQISEILQAAAEAHCLPSDLPQPPGWAVATQPFVLKDYHTFPDRFTAD
ncbi:MAG: Gfo/Idh/MocA family protein [Phycisphaerae bacterium]